MLTGDCAANLSTQRPIKKFPKGRTVWVSRLTQSTNESIEATVTDTRYVDGKWLYKLVDKKGNPVWIDNPGWIAESQLSKE
jgi:hypothetical protein